jgi:hypothetical protein
MSTQIKGCKLYVANGEFFGCCVVVSDPHVLLSFGSSAQGRLTGVESRLEDSDSVILRNLYISAAVFEVEVGVAGLWQLAQEEVASQHTFSMCNSVVFPALSRPRNRSFACLFNNPSDARVSQTRMPDNRQCVLEFPMSKSKSIIRWRAMQVVTYTS